jgi:hypothetical protein
MHRKPQVQNHNHYPNLLDLQRVSQERGFGSTSSGTSENLQQFRRCNLTKCLTLFSKPYIHFSRQQKFKDMDVPPKKGISQRRLYLILTRGLPRIMHRSPHCQLGIPPYYTISGLVVKLLGRNLREASRGVSSPIDEVSPDQVCLQSDILVWYQPVWRGLAHRARDFLSIVHSLLDPSLATLFLPSKFCLKISSPSKRWVYSGVYHIYSSREYITASSAVQNSRTSTSDPYSTTLLHFIS